MLLPAHLERVGQAQQALPVVGTQLLHRHPAPGGHHRLDVLRLHHRHHGRGLGRAAQPRLELQLSRAQQRRLLKQRLL